MLRCHAIARLVNPHNHKCVAAYGWLRNNQQIRYWVSIESDPHLFFSNIDDAREFYRMASGRLRAREAARRP
ncbi:MAG: hypothetical protein J2P41_00110, partial [Blastocatellia bacterium]|nr:hypothetical protein [Blastocatellia bacterium]